MKVFRTISVVVFAFLVMVSASSFVVGMHICMGEVQHIALFDKASSCEKEKSLPACHKPLKPACCEDHTVFHEGTAFKASLEQIHIATSIPIYIAQRPVLLSEIIPATEISQAPYSDYDPPLRSFDLTISLQTFLI